MKEYIINESWDKVLQDKIDDIKALLEKIKELREENEILPKQDEIFNALKFTSFEDTKVLIIGQDPYPSSEHAHGLAFSSNSSKTPESLKNIFKLIDKEFGYTPENNNLKKWADQGVLLLNTALTYQSQEAQKEHLKWWKPIVNEIFKKLKERERPLVVMRWGNKAQIAAKIFENNATTKILDSSHPSPLSVYRGFLDSQHFSLCNEFLKSCDVEPIDWHS